MTQPNQIQVSVIIVSCNSFPSLNDSLRALAKAVTGVSHELIVVDNASTDESVATVKEHFPEAVIIEQQRNLGFAAACNLGAHEAGGEHLLFHNPDLELESDAIVRLLDAANGLERAGALAGRMRFPDGTFQPTCRRFPTLRNMLFSRGSVLSRLAGKSHEYTLPDYEKTTPVPAVAGTLMLVKRKVFEAMGGFDKRFFMYMEDTDLCLRLEQAGYSNYFVPSAGGVHFVGEREPGGKYPTQLVSPSFRIPIFSKALSQSGCLVYLAVCVGRQFSPASSSARYCREEIGKNMPLYTIITGIIASLALSWLTVPLMIRLGHRYGLLDHPGQHKRHKQPTPPLGGVALFLTMWGTVALSMLLFQDFYQDMSGSLFYIFLGALIVTLVGLSDDLSPLSAWTKLLTQIATGLVLYLGGLDVQLLSTPFGSISIGGWSAVLTVLWVVVLTNAINLIDGLDGLAAGVSLIGALTMLAIGQLYSVGGVSVFMLALIGFLGLFLYYNRYPARIFLGDAGSMQIGYYFAVYSLIFPLKSFTATALYIPLLALGVPLMEVLSSFIRRLASGKSIMRADRRHLFHYLSLMGLSPRRVLLVFYSLAVIYGLFALAMFYWNRLIVFGFLAFFMVVIFAIFFIFITKFASRKKLNGRSG